MLRRIALVTHSLDGGVWTVTRFLWDRLQMSSCYSPEIIMLATSKSDPYSIRFVKPASWFIKLQPRALKGGELAYTHFGAVGSELEFQRYRPRRALTALLDSFDLVQVVAGSPAWAAVTQFVQRPVCLFAATMVQQERASMVQRTRVLRKLYMNAMNSIVTGIEASALARADFVFAESNYTLNLLAPYVKPNCLSLGIPGVDTNCFRPQESLAEDGYILSVGRLADPRKNIRLLLNAYKRLLSAVPTAPPLILAGKTSPASSDMEYAKALGLENKMEVRTNLSVDGLASLYRQASMFVLSSDEEGLGMVILEAMASGLPVVSTDSGGPATVISDSQTGFLTPVGDVEALTGAMASLLADPALRHRMGQMGRRRVEAQFSLPIAGQTYLDQYDRILS